MPSCSSLVRRLLALLCGVVLCRVRAQDLDAWDRALRAHVSPGTLGGVQVNVMDYAGMGVDPDFNRFVQSLATANLPADKNAVYALFMNAYNALAIKMVVDHACQGGVPIKSIGDIGRTSPGAAVVVWGLPAGRIGGKMYSLSQIEDLLRNPPGMTVDPRLHACIVCASISCPNLSTQAFRANTVDAQMTTQMQLLLSNQQKGLLLDQASRTITLSKVFLWNTGDFVKTSGSVLDFILPFIRSPADQAFITANKQSLTLAYFDWNRNLNGDPSCRVTRLLGEEPAIFA